MKKKLGGGVGVHLHC